MSPPNKGRRESAFKEQYHKALANMLTAGGPNDIMADIFHDFGLILYCFASEDLREDRSLKKMRTNECAKRCRVRREGMAAATRTRAFLGLLPTELNMK